MKRDTNVGIHHGTIHCMAQITTTANTLPHGAFQVNCPLTNAVSLAGWYYDLNLQVARKSRATPLQRIIRVKRYAFLENTLYLIETSFCTDAPRE